MLLVHGRTFRGECVGKTLMKFNRSAPGSDLLCLLLDRASMSSEQTHKSIAANLKFDHRISATRGERFENLYLPENLAEFGELQNSIDEYQKKEIRNRSPEFTIPELNRENILPTDRFSRHVNTQQINSGILLTRVLILNNMTDVYQWGCRRNIEAFKQLASASRKEVLQRKLAQLLDDSQPGFIETFCQAYNGRRDDKNETKFYPAWVTLWQTVAPYYESFRQSPRELLDFLGMQTPLGASPFFILVLRYPVRDAGRLVRPTQLDAGWNGNHFPSPPSKPLIRGGCALPRLEKFHTGPFVPEFLHAWIRLKPSYVVDVLKVDEDSHADLDLLRNRHRTRLQQQFPDLPPDWMG